MKHTTLRLGAAAIFAAALAACSGAAPSITPVVSAPNALRPAATVDLGRSHVLQITARDRAMAKTFVVKRPRVTYPVFKNPFKALGRPSASVGYPLDMTCQTKQCYVMNASKAYDVYVSLDGKTCTTESCWGHPEEFLKGLTGSSLAGVITQYTGGSASAYTYGGSASVKYPLAYYKTFYLNDLLTILSAAANHFKAVGLNAEYHIFLPPGADTCFDQTSICYSPDNLSSFAFCAYHTAVLLPNGTPIVFSVEPWQGATVNVNGRKLYACQLAYLPKGVNRLDSATASTLSHESFESWSDPLPNTGWFNAGYGMEIGDVCAYSFMATEKLGNSSYYVQQEYSNTYHGCADTP
ncbi:MAG TPA: hypothetical protein VNG31_03130 [Candidatus Baltobacteraceae bacterium]|nr:hypothetical protein [Candidatus Baltobacteraceae bacterium]